MEEENLEQDKEFTQNTEKLEKERNDVLSQLGDSNDSDWSVSSNVQSLPEGQLVQEVEDKLQIEDHNISRMTDIDPQLLKYLEDHRDELTLDFIKIAHETYSDIRASNTVLKEYIDDLKHNQRNHLKELDELRRSNEEAKIKLDKWKISFSEALSSFKEVQVDNIHRRGSTKEYQEKIKDKKNEIINELKSKLESKEKELRIWQEKCGTFERESSSYWKAWRDSENRREALEAEKRAIRERGFMMNQTMNMSSASSMMDDQSIPPPPPINVEEIFKSFQ